MKVIKLWEHRSNIPYFHRLQKIIITFAMSLGVLLAK